MEPILLKKNVSLYQLKEELHEIMSMLVPAIDEYIKEVNYWYVLNREKKSKIKSIKIRGEIDLEKIHEKVKEYYHYKNEQNEFQEQDESQELIISFTSKIIEEKLNMIYHFLNFIKSSPSDKKIAFYVEAMDSQAKNLDKMDILLNLILESIYNNHQDIEEKNEIIQSILCEFNKECILFYQQHRFKNKIIQAYKLSSYLDMATEVFFDMFFIKIKNKQKIKK